MITFGPCNLIPYLKEDTCIFNFSSFKEGYPYLINLNPLYKNTIGNFDTNSYINYIMTYDIDAYKEFIYIMKLAYNGNDIYILIDNTLNISNDIVDILIGYIYNTFGYRCNLVNTVEDMLYLKEGSFNSKGIVYMDQLIENYIRYFGYGKAENYE